MQNVYASTLVQERLFALQDLKYREFQSSLMPTVEKDLVIGVRMPALRGLAREVSREPELASAFMAELPHRYYEENNVHGCLIAGCRDFETCIGLLTDFLTHIDNWATCDLLVPKIFAKHREALLPHIEAWIASDHP